MNSKQSQQPQQTAAIPTSQAAPLKPAAPVANEDVYQVAQLGYN